MTGLEEVETVLERRREVVNQGLAGAVPAVMPERLHGAAEYLLDAGGKRLRPAILLLSAETITGVTPETEAEYREFPPVDDQPVDLLAAAVSIELVQTFTLVHDDLIDEDDVRRGVAAVHHEYDSSTALLAGDVLHARAYEVLLETGAPPEQSMQALARLAHTSSEICDGQTVDLLLEGSEEVTVDEYMEMIEQKTAVLFATAACLPAILLGHEDAIDPLAAYGRDIGRAFQIQDDLLDLTASTETLGKQRGSDLVENKRTLVTVHASEQGVDIDQLLDDETATGVTDSQIDDAVDRLEAAGSLDYARDRAREFVESGKEHLEGLPDNESRRLLSGTADYLLEREY